MKKTKLIALRINPKDFQALDNLAKREDRSVSSVVRLAIKDYLIRSADRKEKP
jgi:hypothetical protein